MWADQRKWGGSLRHTQLTGRLFLPPHCVYPPNRFDTRTAIEQRPQNDANKALSRHIEMLRWCDALCVVYPTWWYSMPAIVKVINDKRHGQKRDCSFRTLIRARLNPSIDRSAARRLFPPTNQRHHATMTGVD